MVHWTIYSSENRGTVKRKQSLAISTKKKKISSCKRIWQKQDLTCDGSGPGPDRPVWAVPAGCVHRYQSAELGLGGSVVVDLVAELPRHRQYTLFISSHHWSWWTTWSWIVLEPLEQYAVTELKMDLWLMWRNLPRIAVVHVNLHKMFPLTYSLFVGTTTWLPLRLTAIVQHLWSRRSGGPTETIFSALYFSPKHKSQLYHRPTIGSTENTRQENDGQWNVGGGGMQDWNIMDKSEGLKNAGLENDGN